MASRMSDEILGEMEDLARSYGFDYPIAWALSFLVDNSGDLYRALVSYGDPGLAKTLSALVKEIKTGVIQ